MSVEETQSNHATNGSSDGSASPFAGHPRSTGRGASACPFLASLAAIVPALAAGLPASAQFAPPIAKPAQATREPKTGDEAVSVRAAVVGEAKAGATVRVAVTLTVHPGWHIYWTNPGESGSPTRIELDLPAGCRGAGPEGRATVDFPTPIVIEHGETVFGYEGTPTLSLAVTLPDPLPASLRVKVRTSWLVCKERCLMGRHETAVDLAKPVDASDAAVAALVQSLVEVPRPMPADWTVELREVADDAAILVVQPPKSSAQKALRFIPDDSPGASLASGYFVPAKDGALEADFSLSRESTLGKPLEIAGIVVLDGASGNNPRAYSLRLPVPAARRRPTE